MEFPVEPLSDDEEAELRELLTQSGSAPLDYARGLFTALSSESSLQDPTEWLGLVLGGEVEDRTTLKRIFTLLVRDLNVVAQRLALADPWVPAPNDHEAIRHFCKGFLRQASNSPPWQGDRDALELTLPLGVLAGYLDHASLREVEPQLEPDAEEWGRDARRRLPEQLLRIYGHFEPLRQRQQPARSERIGRNEPCPCGSGKKYKKCCGA